jgi:gamma-glutamylcyclotransferase (GGCT)/AIG2-like uncharacterized protein YtfP
MSDRSPSHSLPESNALLFAYGTLQRGGQFHYFLEQCAAEFLGEGRLVTPYPLILADYPCLLDRPGAGHCVSGEVYRLPRPADWIAIDRLEAHPVEYIRRLEPIHLNGEAVPAWTYFYQFPDKLNPHLRPVPRFQPGS